MEARIKKWGNSLGVRIPRSLATDIGLKEDVAVDLRIESGQLIIVPKTKTYELDELLARMKPGNVHDEMDWLAGRQRAMVRRRYIPDRGDIIWLQFDPQAGKEQAGLRPALILSPTTYNKLSGLAIACPVTSRIKGYPFEVLIVGKKIKGAVLADHVKSLDWQARSAAFAEKAPTEVVSEVLAKLDTLLK